jgi:hypothetical protein
MLRSPGGDGRMGVGAAGKQVLLLWDVDHTLIENSGVSKAVYARAFELMAGCSGGSAGY